MGKHQVQVPTRFARSLIGAFSKIGQRDVSSNGAQHINLGLYYSFLSNHISVRNKHMWIFWCFFSCSKLFFLLFGCLKNPPQRSSSPRLWRRKHPPAAAGDGLSRPPRSSQRCWGRIGLPPLAVQTSSLTSSFRLGWLRYELRWKFFQQKN